jgi:hypothetical protein
LPKEDMGKGKLSQGGGSLVEEDFMVMSKKWKMSLEETKKNVLELLKQEVEKRK